MLVGIISDTHSHYQSIDKSFNYFKKQSIDLVIHGGDWTSPDVVTYIDELSQYLGITCIGVLGNNDGLIEKQLADKTLIVKNIFICRGHVLQTMIDGFMLAVYHGHSSLLTQDLTKTSLVDIFITGHTHKPLVVTHKSTLIINPGSSRLGTIAVADIAIKQVSFIQLSQL